MLVYGYTNSTWGDLLTNYNGTTITYDASGNPLNWKDASNLYWTGNRLSSIEIDGLDEALAFSYNADGVRNGKTYWDKNGIPTYHRYTVDGNRIISETVSGAENYTLYYLYGANGGIEGFIYNNIYYYFQKNIQGDIIRICNCLGETVVEYGYDVWGTVTSVTGDLASTIGQINPFRYRGYYYDAETGWYYLNARYYDPNVGRFLSPDTILGANGGLQGYNLFAYCNNNPVMFVDPSGRSIILTGLAAKAATALGVLVTPIIVKGIADGLKATADLLDSGIQAIADLFSSSDDKPETVTVTPSAPERTMEDILQDIVDYQKWRPFANILPMPDITFEVNGDIVIFDLSSGTPTIMTKKAGAGISEHTNGSKNWNKHSKKRPGAKEKGDVNRFPRINKKKRNIIK